MRIRYVHHFQHRTVPLFSVKYVKSAIESVMCWTVLLGNKLMRTCAVLRTLNKEIAKIEKGDKRTGKLVKLVSTYFSVRYSRGFCPLMPAQ